MKMPCLKCSNLTVNCPTGCKLFADWAVENIIPKLKQVEFVFASYRQEVRK